MIWQRRYSWWLSAAAVAVIALGGLAVAAYSTLLREEPDLPVSVASGQAYFHRRDFGSPHETGLPYALVLAGMERTPGELGKDRDEFCEKFGTLPDPDRPGGLPVGFVLNRDRLTGTDFVMTNCSLCHTSMVDGRIVDGLGNRNLRLNAMNQAVMRIAARPDFEPATMVPAAQAIARRRGIPWDFRAAWATRIAVETLKEVAARGKSDTGGGLYGIDAGPGRNTPIEFAKTSSRVPIGPPYGWNKLPAIWSFKKRSTFGSDGSLKGDMAFALAAVEFNKNMPAEKILEREARWQSVYAYLKSLVPPAYPRPVDPQRVTQGHALFAEHCSRCHGTYRPDAPKYRERIVSIDVVATDPDRLRSVSPALIDVRSRGPFAKKVRLEPSQGYVAPPLDGVWCRAPYLHNASVPTLEDLLRTPEERPVAFYNGGDTGYDLDRLGLLYTEELKPDGERAGLRTSSRQFLFDTRAPGNKNSGHEFGVELSGDDRRALLEYLKTL